MNPSSLRAAVAGLGVVAFIIGVLTLVSSSVAELVPANETVIIASGALVALIGAGIAYQRRSVTIELADPPDPESKLTVPVPGDDVDELLEGKWSHPKLRTGPPTSTGRRERLRGRLDGLAVTAIMDHDNCTEPQAREQLSTGSWTSDPYAAAYFMREIPEWAPVRTRIRSTVTPTSGERTWARRAITEIQTLTGESDA